MCRVGLCIFKSTKATGYRVLVIDNDWCGIPELYMKTNKFY